MSISELPFSVLAGVRRGLPASRHEIMLASMITPLIVAVVALAASSLLLGCSASTSPAADAPPVSAPPSWCAAVDAALSADATTRGFECLQVPNFLVTGFFGTRENPERSDFKNACFAGNGDASERLGLDVRPAASFGFSLRTSKAVNADGSLDLSLIGPWAPKLAVGSASAENVELNVQLQDAEMRVLPSVAEVLGQEYRAARDDSMRDALETCISALCEARSDGQALYYTSKVLAAVPVVTLSFASNARTHNEVRLLGAAGFELSKSENRAGSVVVRAAEKLNVAARLEPARAALERAGTCEHVRTARARRELSAALRELGLRVLAGRDLAGVAERAAELRTQVMQQKLAFSEHEHQDLLASLEVLEAASRQLAEKRPSKQACDTLSLLSRLLSGSGEDNRLHDTVMEVAQPLHRAMIELANEHSLPCADPIWYRDADGDGYGDRQSSLRSPKAPPDHVANALDCFDRNRDARPGQTKYFADHRGDGSFDYDCDGRASVEREVLAGGCKKLTRFGIPIRCWADAGWQGAVPACGKSTRWLSDCEMSTVFCDDQKEELRRQSCR